MKKFAYSLLLVSFIVLIASLLIFFWRGTILQSDTFYTSADVSDKNIGLDVNSSALTFGKINRGGSSSRNILLENGYPFPIVVELEADGEITKILNYEDTIEVDRGDSVEIALSVYADENTEQKFYEGNVKLNIKPLI
ncbi:hypothetical protein HY450_02465 [Candidatus Pacearchaeota archaeon]|nr:hypothetical protein [Candidatus Pacearchaeota archaeon]